MTMTMLSVHAIRSAATNISVYDTYSVNILIMLWHLALAACQTNQFVSINVVCH